MKVDPVVMIRVKMAPVMKKWKSSLMPIGDPENRIIMLLTTLMMKLFLQIQEVIPFCEACHSPKLADEEEEVARGWQKKKYSETMAEDFEDTIGVYVRPWTHL